jgi:hypothetical protein
MSTPDKDFDAVLKAVESGRARDLTAIASFVVSLAAVTAALGTLAGLLA